jgi:hypothetical protein
VRRGAGRATARCRSPRAHRILRCSSAPPARWRSCWSGKASQVWPRRQTTAARRAPSGTGSRDSGVGAGGAWRQAAGAGAGGRGICTELDAAALPLACTRGAASSASGAPGPAHSWRALPSPPPLDDSPPPSRPLPAPFECTHRSPCQAHQPRAPGPQAHPPACPPPPAGTRPPSTSAPCAAIPSTTAASASGPAATTLQRGSTGESVPGGGGGGGGTRLVLFGRGWVVQSSPLLGISVGLTLRL